MLVIILNNIKELARKIKGTGADEYINFVETLKTMWEDAYYSNESNINNKTLYSQKLFQDILLRNKNLNAESKIPIIYITENVDSTVSNSTRLQESFKNNVKNGEYKNKATNYIASITSETKGKIINPNANKTNFKSKNYILRLISANNLPKLFENAVYIDTLPAMKNKNKNHNELGYHHFVAPININGTDYRVLISGKEKQNSKKLYSLNIEILPQKNGSIPLANTNSGYQSRGILPSEINISDLVQNVNIFNYDTKQLRYSSDRDT